MTGRYLFGIAGPARSGKDTVIVTAYHDCGVNALCSPQSSHVNRLCFTPSLPNMGSGRLPVRCRRGLPQWSHT